MENSIKLFCDHLALEGKSERTISAYKLDLEQFRQYLQRFFEADIPLAAVSVLNIRDFLRWLNEKEDCNRTLARKGAATEQLLSFLQKARAKRG
jgi:site-specific recombinase XerD